MNYQPQQQDKQGGRRFWQQQQMNVNLQPPYPQQQQQPVMNPQMYYTQQQQRFTQGGAQGAQQQGGWQQGYQQTGYQQPAYQQTGYQQTGYQQTGYQQAQPQQQYAPQGAQPQQNQQQAYDPRLRPVVKPNKGQNNQEGQFYTSGYPAGYSTMDPLAGQRQPKQASLSLPLAAKVLYGMLLILFALTILFKSLPALNWVFIGLTVVGIVLMWWKPVVSENTRFTLSAVFGALLVVALVSALTGGAPADQTSGYYGQAGTAAQQSSQQQPVNDNGAYPVSGNNVVSQATDTPAPTEDVNTSETVAQLNSFLYFWKVNKTDEMTRLTSPSWRAGVQAPETALFEIIGIRKLVDYSVEKVNGSASDNTRTVVVKVEISKYTDQEPVAYRLDVLMEKENDVWYVNPRSLHSQSLAEATATPTPSPTPTPTPNLTADRSTRLYYNPDGGSKYHLDQYCPSTHERYLPFKGTFTYGELDNDKYKDLKPCNRCNAPLRN